jgi:PIN domain nuclease of toxin-antitoxin system
VTLLDTHAIIWLVQAHRRARPLTELPRLHVSPASLLELQFLIEAGRVRLAAGRTMDDVAADPRWTLDEPPALRWFEVAGELSWTRDPFDRLIAAHAKMRRWKLATADAHLVAQLPPSDVLAL